MSIRDKLDSIKLHLGSAYAKIQAKGGTLPTDKNISNLASAIETVEGGGGPSNIRLNAPTLSFGQSSVGNAPLIIANTYNGNFVGSYDLYANDIFLDNIAANLVSNTVNLNDYITELGTYTIKVISKGTNFIDSLAATITYKTSLTITNNLINCSNNNPTTEVAFGSSYNTTLVADDGYSFVGATVSIIMGNDDITTTCYSKGKITIPNVTGNIVITATFAVITQLGTPSISLSDSILTITQVANAELYVLCLSGSEWQEFPSNTTTIDLANWLTLTDSYSVTIKAKADGYLDSAQSNSVTFTNSTGETPSATLSDNSWPSIRLICERGQASDYWAVGDTKTDIGTDGTTRTFQIVDMQGLYNKHVVFLQVELETQSYKMNEDRGALYSDDDDAFNNYSISVMRKTTLPSILDKYSVVLSRTITKTTYKNLKNGIELSTDVLEMSDKLFLPAAKEISLYGGIYSNPYESQFLTTFEYYATNTAATYKVKRQNGIEQDWWLRSPHSYNPGSTSYFCLVARNGERIIGDLCSQRNGIAPCFAL